AALGILVDRFAPGRARIVDEHVELLLALLELRRDALDAVLRAEVEGQRDAGPLLRELLRELVAGLRLPRGDVDLRAVLHEARRDHLADAARAAGDEDGLALDAEEIFHE